MLSTDTWIGSAVLVYFSSALASSAGLGGGGLNVPLLLVLFEFPYRQAVQTSLFAVLGNHIAQTIINFPRSHPYDNSRPLIYWELIYIIIPAQLAGSNIGTAFSHVFPKSPLLILAMIILILAIYKSFTKALSLHQIERQAIRISHDSSKIHESNYNHNDDEKKNSNPDHYQEYNITDNNSTITYRQSTIESPLLSHSTYKYDNQSDQNSYISQQTSTAYITTTAYTTYTCDKYDHSNNANTTTTTTSTSKPSSASTSTSIVRKLDYKILFTITCIWIFFAIEYLILHFIFHACTITYYLIFGMFFIPILFIVHTNVQYLIKQQDHEHKPIMTGDITFTRSTMKSYYLPLIAFFVGIICTLLGLGGAELLAPILLSFKILPVVSSATTSMLSFLFTSSSLLHYAFVDKLDIQVGSTMIVVGAMGGFTGRYIALYIVSKYSCSSFICFALTLVLVIGFSLFVYEVSTQPFEWQFHNLCP